MLALAITILVLGWVYIFAPLIVFVIDRCCYDDEVDMTWGECTIGGFVTTLISVLGACVAVVLWWALTTVIGAL